MSDLVIDLTSDPQAVERLAEKLPGGAEVVRLEELRGRGPWAALRRLRRTPYGRSVVVVNAFRTPSRWISMVLLALLPRSRRRSLVDRDGLEQAASWRQLLTAELPFVLNRARITRRVCRVARERIRRIGGVAPARPVLKPQRLGFIRPDLGPPLTAGGSLSHILGVISGFDRLGCATVLLSPTPLRGIDSVAAESVLIPDDETYRLSVELPHLAYNETFLPLAVERLRALDVDFVYQRHALGFYAGARAAQTLDRPLVIEYNGPEVWIARNWGAARRHLDLFEEIEKRVLKAADLVVAVSEPLRGHLLQAGVSAERILINPNGVDAERFDPERFRSRRGVIRRRFGVESAGLLVGFVGTFGPWHGAEVLAEAIPRVPAPLSERMRFLFIGDGARRERCEAILKKAGVDSRATFAGLVPQEETPELLAACDLCVSPHVPNDDGSPFFGSPTKLFEYLASGRAVIASDLGQIGEVLEHDRNAWLVPPGDPGALADALVRLADEPALRRRLGDAGRDDACRRFSWTAHVERILERLAGSA